MAKRFFFTLSILLIALVGFAEGKAKYVFYFIGDGMGVNQVNAAETYHAFPPHISMIDLQFPQIMKLTCPTLRG